MGKKRIVKTGATASESKAKASGKGAKKKITEGTLFVEATFNNTKVSLADKKGNVIFWSSSGSLGFKGAKKGTPFAAAKVGDLLAEKAETVGLKEVDVIVKGVGTGRESAIRSFMSRGVDITSIKDKTPIPFNGPKPKKPRRV